LYLGGNMVFSRDQPQAQGRRRSAALRLLGPIQSLVPSMALSRRRIMTPRAGNNRPGRGISELGPGYVDLTVETQRTTVATTRVDISQTFVRVVLQKTRWAISTRESLKDRQEDWSLVSQVEKAPSRTICINYGLFQSALL